MLGADGKVNMVKCHVCSQIKDKEKLLVPKFDNFQKHVGRCKCKVAKPNCNVGQYYMSIESQHAKNEQFFCSRGKT